MPNYACNSSNIINYCVECTNPRFFKGFLTSCKSDLFTSNTTNISVSCLLLYYRSVFKGISSSEWEICTILAEVIEHIILFNKYLLHNDIQDLDLMNTRIDQIIIDYNIDNAKITVNRLFDITKLSYYKLKYTNVKIHKMIEDVGTIYPIVMKLLPTL